MSKTHGLSPWVLYNTKVICDHSTVDTSIKVPKDYQNVEMFEAIIEEQHWRRKWDVLSIISLFFAVFLKK